MEVSHAFVSWTDARGLPQSALLRTDGESTTPAGASLALGLACEGGLWRLHARALEPVQVREVLAVLSCDLAHADALFLNGYNSWTDSRERPVGARMRNFGVPRAVIDRWVLDGSGDYRFTPTDERRGHQHGFSYGYLRFGQEVELVGSTSEDMGFTTVFEDLPRATLTLSKEPPARLLEAGESRELMSFCVARGTLEEAVRSWLARAGVVARPCKPLVGYSSWYRHYTDISQGKLLHDLAGVEAGLAGLDLEGCVRAFQVDDGYTKVGDWLSPDAGKFPSGLAPVASGIRERGFLPGIWIAPFVCERDSRVYAEHPDWLLRDDSGEPVSTGSHWSGQVALDTQNQEFRAHIAHVLRTFAQDWGFGLLKCDFLYGACMLAHAGMNRGELMADALDLIRSSVGEEVWLDMCGVPLASAMGRAEFCRIGCDVGLDWDGLPHMRLTGRERVSTRNSLANTLGRAHLDGHAFRCDPDVFFLRRDVRLTDARRRDLLMADATKGGVLFTSDDMALWDAPQHALFEEALACFAARAKKGE